MRLALLCKQPKKAAPYLKRYPTFISGDWTEPDNRKRKEGGINIKMELFGCYQSRRMLNSVAVNTRRAGTVRKTVKLHQNETLFPRSRPSHCKQVAQGCEM
jgi:hypothetical protein